MSLPAQTIATAEELATELKQRGIPANVGTGANDYSCNATINNVPVSVYQRLLQHRPMHRDIRWSDLSAWR
ncbi:MAG: hypothetical protein JWR34_7970 [Mycobacterium sp.]|jgi:pyrrolidone-carboxylate peptidase|nr:hypothetical protein [Mycobacterium sp.]